MAKKRETEQVYDDGSYQVKRSRKGEVLSFIVCLLIAFVLWIYATNVNIQKMAEESAPSDAEITETTSS